MDQPGDTTHYGHIKKSIPSLLRFFLVNSVHTTVKITETFKTSHRKLRKRIERNRVRLLRLMCLDDISAKGST
ncbi:MAG: hypothetical protein M1476_00500 [Candidatus Thermoplasmatota archaeon]|nr:hypothetical protein [Candidatus Thermoplasmatota archaeon]